MEKSYIALVGVNELTPSEKLLMMFFTIEDREQANNGKISALLDYIVLMTGLSKSTVQRAIKSLKTKKYITSKSSYMKGCNVGVYTVYTINYQLLDEKLGLNNIKEREF